MYIHPHVLLSDVPAVRKGLHGRQVASSGRATDTCARLCQSPHPRAHTLLTLLALIPSIVGTLHSSVRVHARLFGLWWLIARDLQTQRDAPVTSNETTGAERCMFPGYLSALLGTTFSPSPPRSVHHASRPTHSLTGAAELTGELGGDRGAKRHVRVLPPSDLGSPRYTPIKP